MAKLRKTLGDFSQPYIRSLMSLIQSQSKSTIAHWCLDYSLHNIFPLYDKNYHGDGRPKMAITAAYEWLDGKIKLPKAKAFILAAHAAAREATDISSQAAARACGQAASVIHSAAHSLGMVFYGTAAIAYDKLGTHAARADYDAFAEIECAKMEQALKVIAISDEPNPAKINWRR